MSQLILVTGASGFLGSHIVIQLLQKGYHVRAAARGPRVAELQENYTKFGDKFQVVTVSDVSTDSFPEAFEGVDAVIHSAAPLAQRAEPEAILIGSVQGTLNVVQQAFKAGIKRIIVTSSLVTVLNPVNSFTDKDWYSIEKEKALNGSKWDVYCAAKTLAEKELWAFGDQHPEVDITTINPPFLFGPFAETFTLPTPNYYALSTNLYIYRLLSPSGVFPSLPGYADVRDVAQAHVLALTSPPSSSIGRKRILFSSPDGNVYKKDIELIAEKRPELKDRLIKETPPSFPYDRFPVDFSRIEEVLGLKKEEFKTTEQTILDTVDSLLSIEKQWVAQGHQVSIPNE